MNQLRLVLLITTSSVSLVFPFFKLGSAIAAEAAFQEPSGKFCVSTHQKLVCVKASQLQSNRQIDSKLIARANVATDPDRFVDFTDEESDAAIKLFGCDCPACIRSLRQLKTILTG